MPLFSEKGCFRQNLFKQKATTPQTQNKYEHAHEACT